MVAANLRHLDEYIDAQHRVQELSPLLKSPLGGLENLQTELATKQASTGDELKDWAIIHFGLQYREAMQNAEQIADYLSQQQAGDFILMVKKIKGKDYFVDDGLGCDLGTRNPYRLVTNPHQCTRLYIATLPEKPSLVYEGNTVAIPLMEGYYEARCSGRIKPEFDQGEGEITIPREILPYLHLSPEGAWEAENPQGWSRNTEKMSLLKYALFVGREKVLEHYQEVSGKMDVIKIQNTKDLYDMVTSGLKPAEKEGWFLENQ